MRVPFGLLGSVFLAFLPGVTVRAVPCVVVTSDRVEVADFVSASLSRVPGITLVERGDPALVPAGAGFGETDQFARFGRFVGADRVLYIRRVSANSWELRIVDALSGRLLGSEGIKGPMDDLEKSAAALLQRSSGESGSEGRGIAVLDLRSAEDSAAQSESSKIASLRFAAELRILLASAGSAVLDRSVSSQVRQEQELTQTGWVDRDGAASPLRGAEFVVAGRWDPAGTVNLSLVRIRDGRVCSRKTFSLTDGDRSAEAACRWVLSTIGETGNGVASLPVRTLQLEALEPFYRGVAAARKGDRLSAIEAFQEATDLHDKFVEAMAWEARCYDSLGLSSLASALRVHIQREVVGKGISLSEAAVFSEGVVFLGVTGSGFPPATLHRLEVLATEAASKSGCRVLLPANLAAMRDEYDLLLGLKRSRGVTWEEAPGFLLERGLTARLEKSASGTATLVFEQFDTVSGAVLATRETQLSSDPRKWEGALEETLREFLQKRAPFPAVSPALPPVARPDSDRSENSAILRLALEDPSRLASAWRPLKRTDPAMALALNTGLRQHLLDALPADHALRPWMELEQMGSLLSFAPEARPYLPPQDPISRLARFARQHRDSAPGVVADYMLLFETMARLPYAEIAARAQAIDAAMARNTFPSSGRGWNYFRQMPAQLRQLAAVAQGDPSTSLPVAESWWAAPHRMIPRVGARGEVSLEIQSPWAVREWQNFSGIPRENWPDEARAAIALLGRGTNRFPVDDRWMTDFPNSVALTSYLIRSLREADRSDGLPLRAPEDASRERASYRARVDHVFRQLHLQIASVRTAAELDWMEANPLREFFTELARPGFRKTVTDPEVRAMLGTLVTEVAQRAAVVGRASRRGYHDDWRDWRTLDRSVSSFADPVNWRHDQVNAYDPEVLRAKAGVLLRQESGPLLSSRWFRVLQSYQYATLPPAVRAELLAQGLESLRSDYGGAILAGNELDRLVSYAQALRAGGFTAEAMAIFRRVADEPRSDLSATERSRTARANASLCLAAQMIDEGREVEAVDALRRILDDAEKGPIPLIEDGAWHAPHYSSVQAVALRLLTDLRATEAPVAPEVRLLRVSSPGYYPGKISFWFRLPRGRPEGGAAAAPVIVLAPAVNQGAAEFLGSDDAWSRFADRYGAVLVVPQFMEFWSDSTLPQDWSGPALETALEEIAKVVPIARKGLYLHGFGFGASFLQRLALWKPELCAAASLHSTFDWAWEDALPAGLHPLSALRGVPFFVTCGDEDGAKDHSLQGSYAPTVRFVAFAREAGIDVDWQALPGIPHRPTREMEEGARAFFSRQLSAAHFPADVAAGKTAAPGGSAAPNR